MKMKIGDENRRVWLQKTDDGIDLCIDDNRSHYYIAKLTPNGELMLYRDAAEFLTREPNTRCIATKKEFD